MWISGLHMHIGSGTDFEHLTQVCSAMCDAARHLGGHVRTISAGGGLPIPYKEEDRENRIDITDNYREWLKLGFAIAAEFGTNGEDYFVRLSQFHPKFDPNETAKKYQEFTKNRKAVGIGTFFHIIKTHGLTL